MAANFSLVGDAAEGNSHEFASQSTGDGFAEGSLTYSGRAGQAQNGAVNFIHPLQNGDVFQNPLFGFVQTVMIFIQNLLRFFQVLLVFGFYRPGQSGQPFQVRAQNVVLRRQRRNARQTIELFLRFLIHFRRQVCLLQFFTQKRNISLRFIGFAQFFLNDPQLLLQKEMALGFEHLILYLVVQFALDAQHAVFLFHNPDQLVDPFGQLPLLQDALLDFQRHVQIGGHKVAEFFQIVMLV